MNTTKERLRADIHARYCAIINSEKAHFLNQARRAAIAAKIGVDIDLVTTDEKKIEEYINSVE